MCILLYISILLNIVLVFGAPNTNNNNNNNDNSESSARLIRASKPIPIQPMNLSSSQRAFKVPSINPDSELIYSPSRSSQRYQYEQIMERLQQLPIEAQTGQKQPSPQKQSRKKKEFNFLNFDAYLVKPMNVNYKQVFATLRPEAEKLLRMLNETSSEDLDDTDESNSEESNQ